MQMRLSALLAASVVAGCVSTTPVSAPQTLASDMAGTYETAIGSEDAMRDRRVRLAPLGDGAWVYYQVNHKADLSVYRQRVLQLLPLPDGRVAQSAWTINAPEALVDLWDKPEVQAELSLEDLSPSMDDGCAQIWTKAEEGWDGLVDPETCVIDSSRRGTQIRIGAESKVTAASLSLAERGFSLDGEQLWGTAQGAYYVLDRVGTE